MAKNTDTIKNCPAHLEPALAAARSRWERHRVQDHRAHQAAEVLQFAADIMGSRSWASDDGDVHASLGAWLARTAIVEDKARIAADAAAPKASDLGELSADEIAMILKSRR